MPSNRWIGETIIAGETTTQTRFVYDGNQIIMQFDGGSGNLAAANLSHRYLWGPAVDQLMADEQLNSATGGGYSFHARQHGLAADRQPEHGPRPGDIQSEREAATTSVVNHRVFSAYGQLLSQTNPDEPAAAQWTASSPTPAGRFAVSA